MVKSKYLHELTRCFKRSIIANPVFYKSYFFDEKGATIGMLDWESGDFYLHTNYAHYELAKQSLRDNKVKFKEKEIDLAELVYGQPKTRDKQN